MRTNLRQDWTRWRERGDLVAAAAPMAPSASPKLDFLRTFAVLLVLVSHVDKAQGVRWLELSSLAPIGRLGVLLFFVHTSLVLMFSLERHVALHGHRRLFSTFMLRRVFRIYPLSIAVILAIVIFGIPGVNVAAHSVEYVGTDAFGLIADLLLVQNIAISDTGANALLGPLWSLPLEIQMYLFLPGLFLLVRPIRNARVLLFLWACSVAVSVGTYLAMQMFGMTVAHVPGGRIDVPKILVYAPYFLAGILAYAFWRHARQRVRFAALPGFLLVSLVLYIGVSNAPGGEHTVDIFGMVICLGVGLLLPVLIEPAHPAVCRVSATVAKYSYGIYLVHVPCIWLGFDVFAGYPLAVQWLVFLGGTAALAATAYHVIERPFITLGARLGTRWAEDRSRRADRRPVAPPAPAKPALSSEGS